MAKRTCGLEWISQRCHRLCLWPQHSPHAPTLLDVHHGRGGRYGLYARLSDAGRAAARRSFDARPRRRWFSPIPMAMIFASWIATPKKRAAKALNGLLASAPRPLYYSTMNPHLLPALTLQQEGLLYTARQGERRKNTLWPLYDFRGVPPWDSSARRRKLRLPHARVNAFLRVSASDRLDESRPTRNGLEFLKERSADGARCALVDSQPCINRASLRIQRV